MFILCLFILFIVDHHAPNALLLGDLNRSLNCCSDTEKSYNEWKKSLLKSQSPSLPVVGATQVTNNINAEEIKRYGDQLREDGYSYEALYIYMLAYENYQHRHDAEGIGYAIYWMGVTILEMDKQTSKRTVVGKWQNTADEVMTILNELALSGDEKARQEANNLFGIIGYLNMEFTSRKLN